MPAATESLLAKDAYREWTKRVKSAEHSIVVFTPYFDRLLEQLLGNATVGPESITVVTDLSPTGGSEYLAQLTTIQRMLSAGIEVRSLERLHAKVLLVDDANVSLGSQNFTSFARKSKECTAVPGDQLGGSRFVEQLLNWNDEASRVDEALVAELLARLAKSLDVLGAAEAELLAEYEDLMREREEREQRRRAAQLAVLASQSRFQLSQSEAKATIKRVESYASVYKSLVADPGVDLTNWVMKPGTETSTGRKLVRLQMIPIMISESGRLGFARVASTRITYVRFSVQFDPVRLGDRTVKLGIDLPQTGARASNLHIKVRVGDSAECRVRLLFDGERLEFVDARRFGRTGSSAANRELVDYCSELFRLRQFRDEFFQRHMRGFRFAELGIWRTNADAFFNGTRVRLRLIEFAERPVMVAEKIW